MSAQTHTFDLAGLQLSPGAGRRLRLTVPIEALELGGQRYEAQPTDGVPVTIDVSRMAGRGYALKLELTAQLAGPCMRCLKDAAPRIQAQAREVDVAGAGEQSAVGPAASPGATAGAAAGAAEDAAEEMSSPYVRGDTLDVAAWAHDALALAVPLQVLCRQDCAGLCPQCAADLNETGPGHSHERVPNMRWAKLSELKLD